MDKGWRSQSHCTFPIRNVSSDQWARGQILCVYEAEYLSFELWCWRRLLRVPWTARRSNQSILKDISLGCSLEGLMLKLKLQYFGHLMGSVDSLEKTLMLGGIWGRRKKGRQRMRWLNGMDSMDISVSELRELAMDGRPGVLRFMGSQKSQTWLSDWTELNWGTELNCPFLNAFYSSWVSSSIKYCFLSPLQLFEYSGHNNQSETGAEELVMFLCFI